MGMHDGYGHGPGMMGDYGPGMMEGFGPGAMMGPGMFAGHEDFDTNGDGRVTLEEMRQGMDNLLSDYDADGDGSLSLEEFEALHDAMMREHMVDRFQFLDDDGDGLVTIEEMHEPARMFDRMRRYWSDEDDAGGDSRDRMMDRGMMDDD